MFPAVFLPKSDPSRLQSTSEALGRALEPSAVEALVDVTSKAQGGISSGAFSKPAMKFPKRSLM